MKFAQAFIGGELHFTEVLTQLGWMLTLFRSGMVLST
jgi:hypothetical protein